MVLGFICGKIAALVVLGAIAQWKSACFAYRRSRVRTPVAPIFFVFVSETFSFFSGVIARRRPSPPLWRMNRGTDAAVYYKKKGEKNRKKKDYRQLKGQPISSHFAALLFLLRCAVQ